MCEAHPYTTIRKANDVARGLLGEVAKTIDVSTPEGFDRAVARLADQLKEQVGPLEGQATSAAVARLDVDWKTISASKRAELLQRAFTAMGASLRRVPAKLTALFGKTADEVFRATREHGRRKHRLQIDADFNAVDQRMVDYLQRSSALFVTDNYQRRLEAVGERARAIVAEGVESGVGRNEIAEDLRASLGNSLSTRGGFYWEVVAGAFVGRSRSFSQLSSFAEARIERYMIEAVMDERTTEICRFLHGKTFSVRQGLGQFEEMEKLSDPLQLKEAQPWVQSRAGGQGGKQLYVKQGDAKKVLMEYGSDDESVPRNAASLDTFADLGVTTPPFHGLCRTTLIPVV